MGLNMKDKQNGTTMMDFERYLNEKGFPEGEYPTGKGYKLKQNYGSQMRLRNLGKFKLMYEEWKENKENDK